MFWKKSGKSNRTPPPLLFRSFADVAQTVHELHAPGWSNRKYVHEWIQSLKTYAFPVIGRKPISEIQHRRRYGDFGATLE